MHGDLSILSFHATKIFNTFEGGAIISPDEKTKRRIDDLKNFGFHDEVTVVASGINGKMNELQAAFGLLQLKYIDKAISRRRDIDTLYRNELASVKGITCHLCHRTLIIITHISNPRRGGLSPVPDNLYERLREHNIFARRYFYPLISEFPMYRGLKSASKENLPLAYKMSRKILVCRFIQIYQMISFPWLRIY